MRTSRYLLVLVATVCYHARTGTLLKTSRPICSTPVVTQLIHTWNMSLVHVAPGLFPTRSRGVERWKQFEPCGAATTPATVTTIKAGDTVAPFLSVRTAFDLYLKALALPRGSLVVCSALTIPDMVKIFLEHGLVPLPVDLDPNTLAPDPGALESEVEKASDDRAEGSGTVRAIYVAHVFGAQARRQLILPRKKDGHLFFGK